MSTDDPDAILPAAVLDFWFAGSNTPRAEWFRKDPAFDALVGERFGALIERALSGEIDHWSTTSGTALARILLLDQFTRNAFRDTPQSFAGDVMALQAARDLVRRGFDRQLPALQRWFAYLPFEHAEDPAAQQESLRHFGELAAEVPQLSDALTWARKHHEVIARFGRYPHRNAILGRQSTPEELAFLREPGAHF